MSSTVDSADAVPDPVAGGGRRRGGCRPLGCSTVGRRPLPQPPASQGEPAAEQPGERCATYASIERDPHHPRPPPDVLRQRRRPAPIVPPALAAHRTCHAVALRPVTARRYRLHGVHQHHAGGDLAQQRRRLTVVLAITVAVLVVEVVGAAVSGSLALLADAGHGLTDAAGLTLALVATGLRAAAGDPAADVGLPPGRGARRGGPGRGAARRRRLRARRGGAPAGRPARGRVRRDAGLRRGRPGRQPGRDRRARRLAVAEPEHAGRLPRGRQRRARLGGGPRRGGLHRDAGLDARGRGRVAG